MSTRAEIVICGAGVAGVSAAYHLVVRRGVRNVVLVDERPPLSLTSAYGTEAYRNWWPDLPMFRFISRSIDLLEDVAAESGNAVRMNRRGYVFLTGDPRRIPELEKEAEAVAGLGGGALRIHHDRESYVPSQPEGLQPDLTGADLVLDTETIARLFPFLTDDTAAMLHVRRCGWMDVPSLGRWMLDRIDACGGKIVSDRIAGVDTRNNRVTGVRLTSGSSIETGKLVLAAGPMVQEAGRMLDLDIPVFMELHGKIIVEDTAGILPPDAPMLIWTDPVELVWDDDERRRHAADPDARHLIEPFAAGLHIRPRFRDGKQTFLGIWTYDIAPGEAVFPLVFDPAYPMIVLRGLARMIPGMRSYFDRADAMPVDGGYYCKTPDNRPLIGPLPIEGTYIAGALSGYGVMGSQAAGELVAAHVTGEALPDYAQSFSFDRFDGLSAADLAGMGDATRGQL
ncbi:MAG: FAD-binding oxidoreductase [Gemmatimonadetes bacterium]|nr:FAD-binding oxidoreductase [Gemmatimonadota bacterium]MYG86062.1 FAD-binding oxidoreductase [Gemmatimonadota bacterium]MYJ90976.1 FAD-binding oxidoreductase [Gemmatimonadota bacterium]